jgi:hypothetical protein
MPEALKSKEDVLKTIAEKLAILPTETASLSSITRTLKEGQASSLTERSIDDFLKIIKDPDMRNRMTRLDNELLVDCYDAELLNTLFYKRFARTNPGKYDPIIDHTKELFVSAQGRGLDLFENVAAGRAAQDVGLFRGIFNLMTNSIFGKDKEK